MKNKHLKNNGFSLIEILIAVTVTAIIFPAVISLLGMSTFTTSQGETYTKAGSLAQKEMEKIYSTKASSGWDSVPTGGPSCSNEGIYSKCTTVSSVNPSEKLISVNISWNERGETKQISIVSIIANI